MILTRSCRCAFWRLGLKIIDIYIYIYIASDVIVVIGVCNDIIPRKLLYYVVTKLLDVNFHYFCHWKTCSKNLWTSVSPCFLILKNQIVICNMFRDRCISYLSHALQVIYTLLILVGSHFAFPILAGFCLCFQSLSDLFLC